MAAFLHRPLLLGVLAFTASLSLAMADTAKKDHDHSHGHSHSHDEAKSQIYKGYFEDSQIGTRALSDWEGDWQSVYPLLKDGTLDAVMAEKAAHGDKSAAGYKAYYETGYATETDRITITGDQITFQTADGTATGTYAADGYEILTYEKGNRGVRFIFRKTAGDARAPGFIQFSDHIIAPEKSGHFHLYFGDDRAALLQELTNWPTYYPAALSGAEIVTEMTAH